MPRTKIAYLLEDLKRGGVQKGALLQIPQLNREKYEVQVWTLESGKRADQLANAFRDAGVAVCHTPVRGLGDSEGLLALAGKLARERVGLLNTKSFLPNLVGRMAAKMAGTPAVIANYHNTYRHRWTPRFLAYERALRRGCDGFLCVSQAVRDTLAALLALPQDRVFLVYNGFDLERFLRSMTRAEARASLALPPEIPLVAYVGRLTEVKDVATLVHAMPRVREAYPLAMLLVVGDGPEKRPLREQAASLGLEEAVTFLGSRDDVPTILAAVDCLVLPSRAEGFPRIVMEAFAAGAPVVSTPVDGAVEIVEEGRTGLLFGFGDAAGLARAIDATLRAPQEAQLRCQAALRAVERFTIAAWNSATEEMFDGVISSRQEAIRKREASGRAPSRWTMASRLLAIRLEAVARRPFMRGIAGDAGQNEKSARPEGAHQADA